MPPPAVPLSDDCSATSPKNCYGFVQTVSFGFKFGNDRLCVHVPPFGAKGILSGVSAEKRRAGVPALPGNSQQEPG